MDLLLAYALTFIGTPYKFGGKNPIEGLDCSGLVSEILKAAGVLKNSEVLNAQGLYDKFDALHSSYTYGIGSLAFYGKDAKNITHVAWCVDSNMAIGADGGDSLTLTESDAAAKGAFTKLRPVKYRADFLFVVKPSYVSIGIP